MDSAAAEFDYIIAGAGTAGCVLASRLSEDPSVRVCLLEAGGRDESWMIKVPAAVAGAIGDPRLSWGYKTVPQAHANGRNVPIPRGKVLGGCSSINGMVYFRGHPQDFEEWGAVAGSEWSYRSVLPYFLRSENNEDWLGSPYHGAGGPMNVTDIRRDNPLNRVFLAATDSMQLPRCADFNGPDPEGFGVRQATIRKGRRESEVTAFLSLAKGRRNLEIVTDALVRRVVIEGGRAMGVEIETPGGRRTIAARREVVLCGGSFGSPQMLMLSGVGDGAALRTLGIEVKHDLPQVGRNLGDHPAAPVANRTKDPRSYGLSPRAFLRDVYNIAEYLLTRRGPLASFLLEAHGFVRSKPELERPDLQLVFIPAHRNASGFPIPFGHGYGMIAIAVRARSKGTVRLASADPHEAPLIDPNLLSDPEDLETLVRGTTLARRIMTSEPFKPLQGNEIIPGEAVQDLEAWRDYVRRAVVTVHHPSTTCRMGSDAASVVDPQLKVRGIEGLRVADASIFPNIVAGNSNAAVVMVAEKAADLIRGRSAPAPADVAFVGARG